MKTLFILGNWKTYAMNLTPSEWVKEGMKQKAAIEKSEKDKDRHYIIILCPPYSKLQAVREAITAQNAADFIKLGTQDISAFPSGAHTGDESVSELKKNFDIEYAIIGHSERRREHKEEESLLVQKVALALKYNVVPVFCVQDETNTIPTGVTIVAYEPPNAISAVSGGIPETPENTEKVASVMRQKLMVNGPETYLLYGGSVNAQNVASFTQNIHLHQNFDGVLVGAKSLVPEFFKIVENA